MININTLATEKDKMLALHYQIVLSLLRSVDEEL